MRAKYQVRKQNVNRVERIVVCIGCGKRKIVEIPGFMPIANPTRVKPPSRLDCWMKLHIFVDISKVERIR